MEAWSDSDRERLTVAQLDRQLRRMRGMLFGYSQLFFVHMRVYALATIGLLAAAMWQPLGGVVLIALYLVATWLLRPDERRLIEELEAVYPTATTVAVKLDRDSDPCLRSGSGGRRP